MSKRNITEARVNVAESLESSFSLVDIGTILKSTEKSAKMGSIKLNAAGLCAIYEQLVKARFMENPYENPQLVWEEDTLWKTIVENANLQVDISVHYASSIVRSHHGMFLKDPLLPEVDDSLRSLVATFFKPLRDRGHGQQLGKIDKHIDQKHTPIDQQHTPRNYGLELVQAVDRLKDHLKPSELRWIEDTVTRDVVRAEYFLALTDPQKLEFVKRHVFDWKLT